ncbi:MAG: hypothetical protein Q4B30_05625 [Coriobacteriaceae bacterium]|nr:hypothetical protein [Coriobacteriaceae bacterium]
MSALQKLEVNAMVRGRMLVQRLSELPREDSAQGTTEYAILVGVLVVIAIVAIVAFRGKVSELWDSISNGINSL